MAINKLKEIPGQEHGKIPVGGVFIIIAAYNEQTTIASVVKRLLARYREVVVVDDGSTDNTASFAAQTGAVVLRHIINRGQGAALQTGITYALKKGAGYVVTFDGDGQHQVEDIANLMKPLLEGTHDVALGSRFLNPLSEIPPGRHMLLKLAVFFTRVTSGTKLTDTHNGIRALNRRGASCLNIRMDRMAHASEIIDQIFHSDLRICEVPVKIAYTDYSLSKGQSHRDAIHVAFDYLLNRFFK